MSATTPSGRAKAAGSHHARTTQRPKRAPSAPRRVSGPIRRVPPRRAATAPSRSGIPRVAERAGAFLRSLPDHALVDRLVRGRAWIPVLGVMLAGIVFMQVEVLKLGTSVGRSIEATSALTTRNQLLRASVASLSDQARIERLAAGMGMIMPSPGSIGFLSARPDGNLGQALANIHAPDPSAFLSSQASNGAVATTSILSTSDGSIEAIIPGSLASSGTTGANGQASPSSTGGSTGAGASSQAGSQASAATTARTTAQRQSSLQPAAPAQVSSQPAAPTQSSSQQAATAQSPAATTGSGAASVNPGATGGG